MRRLRPCHYLVLVALSGLQDSPSAYLLVAQPRSASTSLLETLKSECRIGGTQVTDGFAPAALSRASWSATNQAYAPALARPWTTKASKAHLTTLRGGAEGPPCPPDFLLNMTSRAITLLHGVERVNASSALRLDLSLLKSLTAEGCVARRAAFKNGTIQTHEACFAVMPHSDMFDQGVATIDTWGELGAAVTYPTYHASTSCLGGLVCGMSCRFDHSLTHSFCPGLCSFPQLARGPSSSST